MPRNETVNDANETLDLICETLELFQSRRGYRFGIESLLLAGFAGRQCDHMLDLGTGSGILPLVMTRFYQVASAVGVELQSGLVDRARRSVAHNGLEDQIEIVQADLRDLADRLPPSYFDLVVVNPPYGRAGQGHLNPDDEKAVARHELRVTLAQVVAAAASHVRVRGTVAWVLPPGRLVELLDLCLKHDLCPARLRFTHGRLELPAKHCLLEAVRGGRMELEVLPPLIIYDDAGDYTPMTRSFLYPASQARNLPPTSGG